MNRERQMGLALVARTSAPDTHSRGKPQGPVFVTRSAGPFMNPLRFLLWLIVLLFIGNLLSAMPPRLATRRFCTAGSRFSPSASPAQLSGRSGRAVVRASSWSLVTHRCVHAGWWIGFFCASLVSVARVACAQHAAAIDAVGEPARSSASGLWCHLGATSLHARSCAILHDRILNRFRCPRTGAVRLTVHRVRHCAQYIFVLPFTVCISGCGELTSLLKKGMDIPKVSAARPCRPALLRLHAIAPPLLSGF
jgi:hypothetical protein